MRDDSTATLRLFVGQSCWMPKGSEVEISISEVCAIETQKLQVEAIKNLIKTQNQRVFAAGAGKKAQKIAKQLTACDIRGRLLCFARLWVSVWLIMIHNFNFLKLCSTVYTRQAARASARMDLYIRGLHAGRPGSPAGSVHRGLERWTGSHVVTH
jgi:hypothetical protein